MKIAIATTVLAKAVATTEGKKAKTSGDYRSMDGDRFAAKWVSSSSNGWSGEDDDWNSSWSSKSGKGGKSGSGGGSFECQYKTFYIDINSSDILDDPKTSGGGIAVTYTNFKVYKESKDVGNTSYDGVLAYQRVEPSNNSCQGQIMLGVGGGGPVYKDQIYVSLMCDPTIDDTSDSGYITDGGITGGIGSYAMATGTMSYETSSSSVGKVKLWYCLPYGARESWGSSWGDDDDSWDR